MSYTGISEIDVVLLDLYREQVFLKKALLQEPKSRVLIQRYRRVVELADRLFEFGKVLQGLPFDVPQNT